MPYILFSAMLVFDQRSKGKIYIFLKIYLNEIKGLKTQLFLYTLISLGNLDKNIYIFMLIVCLYLLRCQKTHFFVQHFILIKNYYDIQGSYI